MKIKTLVQALFLITIFAAFSPLLGQDVPTEEQVPKAVEPAIEAASELIKQAEDTAVEAPAEVPKEKLEMAEPQTEKVETPEKEPEPEPDPEELARLAFEAKSDALKKVLTTAVYNTDLTDGKRRQLRSMALAAYRANKLEPLWADLTSDLEISPAMVVEEVKPQGVIVIASTTGEIIDRPVATKKLVAAPGTIYHSMGEALVRHGFSEGNLSFYFDSKEKSEDAQIPYNDMMITLALAETCLRMKQGPESVSEWPNWTFGDKPIPTSTSTHYDEVTERFGEVASGAIHPLAVVDDFIPGNWVYRRILDMIHNPVVEPEPPSIDVSGLVKVGNEFPEARELADYLAREGHMPSEESEVIEAVYTAPLSEALRSYQKEKGLLADGIFGPKTALLISKKEENREEKLNINLHRARRLPDDLGDRYLLANLPSGEVHGFDNGAETLRMRVVFGKHKAGQHTPIFRDKMENVVFRPYWNVPYSIAIGESNYSDLGYLQRKGFKIISSSSGASLPLTGDSLARVRSSKAYVRQDAGDSNALGLVKFLFPNKHAVYFHDTPSKHYFEKDYRAQSHGCVRLQQPEAMANWVLDADEEWDSSSIKHAIYEGERNQVDLEEPIPVYIVYFTAFPDPLEEQGVEFHRDYYEYDKPGAVIDAPAPKPKPVYTKIEEDKQRKQPIFKFFKNRGNSNRSGQKRTSVLDRLRARQN